MGVMTDSIRNIVLTGHVSTGKTSLVDQMLYAGHIIQKPETVEGGKTVSDFASEEISRQISIYASLTHLNWKDTKINILDTPGSADFSGEVIASLKAAESAVVLVGADTGVQIETIKVWRRLDVLNMPRIVYVNKMEKENAKFSEVLDELKERFSANFIPVTIPIGAAETYGGVISLLDRKAYMSQNGEKPAVQEIPEDMKDTVEQYRTALIEAATESDDALMEKYLEDEILTDGEILQGLKDAVSENKCTPVLFGSVLRNSGVSSLLDFIADVAPSPGGFVATINEENEESQNSIDPEGAPSCFVFKTNMDQFSGRLSYIKMVTGKLRPESELINTSKNEKEKIARLYTCQGKKLEDADELAAGDVGVLVKLISTGTGDTLRTAESYIKYKPIDLPQPVHSVTISAGTKKDEDKLNQFLQREVHALQEY